MTLEELTQLMYRLSVPTEMIPGTTFPEAVARIYGLIIGQHLGVSDEELVKDLLAPGMVPASDHQAIGRAFSAAMLRGTGNSYAAQVVIGTLKEYSGKEVSPEVAKLLKVLEQYIVRSGDFEEKDPQE